MQVPVFTVVVRYMNGQRENWTAFGEDGAQAMVAQVERLRYIAPRLQRVDVLPTGHTVRI